METQSRQKYTEAMIKRLPKKNQKYYVLDSDADPVLYYPTGDLKNKYLFPNCRYGELRRGKGFPVPLDDWFSGNSNNFAKEIWLDGETKRRGLFNYRSRKIVK